MSSQGAETALLIRPSAGQSNQSLLPLVGQRGVVAVSAAHYDAPELRDHAQRVLQDFRNGGRIMCPEPASSQFSTAAKRDPPA